MAQFAVHHNPNRRTRRAVPYLLDVQTDLLDLLATRVVVPLVRADAAGGAAERLNPTFVIDGKSVVMSTAELAGVPLSALGESIESLDARRAEILGAHALLYTGI